MSRIERFGQSLSRGIGHVLFFMLLAGAALLLLFLMPGIIVTSVILDQIGVPLATLSLWIVSVMVSGACFLLILALVKDSNKSLKLYVGSCAGMLLLSIILSSSFHLHLGHRWAERYLGISTPAELDITHKP